MREKSSTPPIRQSETLENESKSGCSEDDSKKMTMKDNGAIANAKDVRKDPLSSGGLTTKEGRVEGGVTFRTYLDFCKGSGYCSVPFLSTLCESGIVLAPKGHFEQIFVIFHPHWISKSYYLQLSAIGCNS